MEEFYFFSHQNDAKEEKCQKAYFDKTNWMGRSPFKVKIYNNYMHQPKLSQ